MTGIKRQQKRDFCCLIFYGFGDGAQAELLAYHLRESGMDAYTCSPAEGKQTHVHRQYWVHSCRMQYLRLRRQYRRIVIVGVESGAFYLMRMADLKPAGMVFVNAPVGCLSSMTRRVQLFWSDIRPVMKGIWQPLGAFYHFYRFMNETLETGVKQIACPAIVIQTYAEQELLSDANNLYAHLTMEDRMLRCYPHAGESLIGSRAALAVCSDVFQFCARIRAEEQNGKKMV